MSLSQETCEACRVGAPLATPEERVEFMRELPEWTLVTVEGVDQLRRVYTTRDYASALGLTQSIAMMADEMDHHPAITLEWGRVSVSWWSHKIKGLHRNDFVCAAKTDKLYEAEVG